MKALSTLCLIAALITSCGKKDTTQPDNTVTVTAQVSKTLRKAVQFGHL
jgi:hypothetical protein